MAPPSWTTVEQKDMLLSWLPKFIERQGGRKTAPLLAIHDGGVVSEIPRAHQVEFATSNQRKRAPLVGRRTCLAGFGYKGEEIVENWVRNHSKRVGGSTSTAVTTANNSMVQRIFKLSAPKRHRIHHHIEVFQTRNKEVIAAALKEAGYDELLPKHDDLSKGNKGKGNNGDGDNSDSDNGDGDNGDDKDGDGDNKDNDDLDDWTDESEDTPAARLKRAKSKRMRLRTRVVQNLWKAASAEERAAVEAEIADKRARLNEEELLAEQEKTPEKRQKEVDLDNLAIDALDGVFTEVHKVAHATTGWVGISICGGPNPRMNGELTMKIVCFGETPSGNDFEACCVDFDKNVTQPFQEYLRLCFSKKDSAEWALPSTASMATDQRPVERVTAPPVAPEKPVTAAKKEKSKKKSKTKSKKSDVNKDTEPVANPSDTEVPMDDMPLGDFDQHSQYGDESVVEESGNELDALPPLPPAASSFPPAPSLWPPGMTSPLHPSEAAPLACIERGGTENAATMAIDPQLVGLCASPPSSPTPFPIPRPAWKGAQAPRLADHISLAPLAPVPFLSVPTAVSPPLAHPSFLPLPKTVALQMPARSTAAARNLLRILEDHDAEKTPTLLPVVPIASTPRWVPSTTPPLAPPHPVAPMPATPPPMSPASAPTPTVPEEEMELPESRPHAKPLKLKQASVAKPVAKGRKTSSAKSVEKQTAAAQAALVVVKKPRGRPRKTPLDDITNMLVDPPAPAATTDTTTTDTTLTSTPATSTPTLVYTSTNNNRAAAKAAAAAEKREKEREAEEARAKEAARGWSEKTVDGATVVTLKPLTRVHRAAKLPDGSAVQTEVKKMRKKRDSCELLLARAAKERATKARANAPAAGKGKRASKAVSAPTKQGSDQISIRRHKRKIYLLQKTCGTLSTEDTFCTLVPPFSVADGHEDAVKAFAKWKEGDEFLKKRSKQAKERELQTKENQAPEPTRSQQAERLQGIRSIKGLASSLLSEISEVRPEFEKESGVVVVVQKKETE
ncbi:hypothetical protein C8R45DRAFT_947073 [Mycena sanguinolenta]|nr:hypothetical protein C8R45DRAFT_947073 [Mycena sanguinolenta]